jgi:hypothetical protein
MPAHDDVHLRLVEHVPHVESTGDVRGGRSVKRDAYRQARGRSVVSFSLIQKSAQRDSIAPGSYDLGSSCGMR